MSLIARSLNRADERAESYRQDARLQLNRSLPDISRPIRSGPIAAGSGGMGGAVAANPTAATALGYSRYSQSAAHHAEQYAYFTGYPYAIVNTIANRLAAQPIRVGRLLPHGEKARKEFRPLSKDFLPKTLQEVLSRIELYPEHRITDAINDPNPLMVRHHLLYMTFASLEITGRGYWWIFTTDDGKDQIWPVPSHWIEPFHKPEKLFAYYRVMLPGAGEPIKVPTRQIVPFMMPDPSDPFGCLSPLQAMARTVMADFSMELAQRMSFENGINPGLAIMVGKPPEFAGVGGEQMVLTKAQRDQIIQAVRRQYRGVTRFEEPLILDALIKDVKSITNSPKEMAYRDSGTITRNRLTQGWAMNPIVMGEIEGVNYASSGVADHHVCRGVYQPRSECNSQTMTCYLPPYFGGRTGERLIIYQEPPTPQDPELEHKREMDFADRALMNRNEIRSRHGLGRIKNGTSVLTHGGAEDGSGGNWVKVEAEDGSDDAPEAPRRERNRGRPFRYPFDSLDWRLQQKDRSGKTTDEHGQEHDNLGRFGHGSGGGSGGGSGSGTGSVHDESAEHEKRARGLAAKIKKFGKKALHAAKTIKTKAAELSARAAWAYISGPIKIDDIADTAWDYSKITYNRNNYLTEHLGVGANTVAVVASHVFAYGIVKLKQAIAAKKQKGFKDADDGGSIEKRAHAVADILQSFLPALGVHHEDLPTYGEILDRMKKDDEKNATRLFIPTGNKAIDSRADALQAGQVKAEEAIRRAASAALTRLGRHALKRIKAALGKSDHGSATEIAAAAIEPGVWERELKRVLKPAVYEAVLHGAGIEWGLFRANANRKARKPVPDTIPQRIVEVARKVSEKILNSGFVKKIVGWFRKKVKRAIGDGLAGETGSTQKAAGQAKEVLTGEAVNDSARQIAANESGPAVNGGQDGVRKELEKSGEVMVSIWITQRDEKVRKAHRDCHGQKVSPGKPFVCGGHECRYPGDPSLPPELRCNCRCFAITVYPGETADGIGEAY